MKQIKSNNWLDLLVKDFCWPRADWWSPSRRALGTSDIARRVPAQGQNACHRGHHKPVQERKRQTFPQGRRFVCLRWIFPLYNNVLSLRLLFLMRMMFITFIIVSFVLLYCVCFACFYFLVFPLLYISSVLRFRDYFLIFSISSSFTNDCYHKHFLCCMFVCVFIFSLSFVSSLFALSREVRQGTKIDFTSRGLRGVGCLTSFFPGNERIHDLLHCSAFEAIPKRYLLLVTIRFFSFY